MGKRKNRIKKAIESLERQKQIHLGKIDKEKVIKDTTKAYWRKEVGRFGREIEKKKKLLNK